MRVVSGLKGSCSSKTSPLQAPVPLLTHLLRQSTRRVCRLRAHSRRHGLCTSLLRREELAANTLGLLGLLGLGGGGGTGGGQRSGHHDQAGERRDGRDGMTEKRLALRDN